MTTNHRPTLESKRGKRLTIKNTISHSRALPQQTRLKYRSDIPVPQSVLDEAVNDLKEEPVLKRIKLTEGRSGDEKILDETTITRTQSIIKHSHPQDDKGKLENENEKENYDDDDDNEDDNDNDDDDKEEDENEEEDDDDDDDETAELLAEIEKIRNEKKQQEEEKIKSANPLIKLNDQTSARKSWRSSTPFRNTQQQPEISKPKFTTDTLKSEYHQKFLSKTFR